MVKQIQKLADKNRRSFVMQTIVLIEAGLNNE
jgi:hypothetical protein